MTLLRDLRREKISLSEEKLEQFRQILWGDLRAEHDAENLCQWLQQADCSSEFTAFERVWRRDELNHFLGFRRLYCLLYGIDEASIDRQLKARVTNFELLKDFLQDEFTIVLTIAYDEIATTLAYTDDYEMYRSLGDRTCINWIKNVVRDEGIHFQNCIELLKRYHVSRINEIPDCLQELVKWDLQRHEYQGTFLFDRATEQFTPAFLDRCQQILLSHFKLPS